MIQLTICWMSWKLGLTSQITEPGVPGGYQFPCYHLSWKTSAGKSLNDSMIFPSKPSSTTRVACKSSDFFLVKSISGLAGQGAIFVAKKTWIISAYWSAMAPYYPNQIPVVSHSGSDFWRNASRFFDGEPGLVIMSLDPLVFGQLSNPYGDWEA